jgi:hypothetical protein
MGAEDSLWRRFLSLTYFTIWRSFGSVFLPFFLPSFTLRGGYNIKTMEIEERIGKPVSWVAAIHDDHTTKRHIHVLAVTKARFLPAKDMIRTATATCVEQRQELDVARQKEQEHHREEGREWQRERSK